MSDPRSDEPTARCPERGSFFLSGLFFVAVLAVVSGLAARLARGRSVASRSWHPVYPPTSAGIVDVTTEDRANGKAGYLRYEGQRLRPLHRYPIHVCQGMRFSRTVITIRDVEVDGARWDLPSVEVVSVRHVRVRKGDFQSAEHQWEEFVDVVLRDPQGRTAHWIWTVVPLVDGVDEIPSDPVEDAILSRFVPEGKGEQFQLPPDAPELESVLDQTALSRFPEPPPAPSLARAPAAARAAAEDLIARLAAAPQDALCAAVVDADRYPYREVARAVVQALGVAASLPPRQGNTHQECAAGILSAVGDPMAVDALLALLGEVRNQEAAILALGRIGSARALPALERIAREADPQRAGQALAAMCSILGMPESRDVVKTAQFRPRLHDGGSRLRYAALSYVRGNAHEVRYIREAARSLETFLADEPQGPRAEVARRVRAAIERLHGM